MYSSPLTLGGAIPSLIDARVTAQVGSRADLTFRAPAHPGCPEDELRSAAPAWIGSSRAADTHAASLHAYESQLALLEQQYNAVAGRTSMLDAIDRRIDQIFF